MGVRVGVPVTEKGYAAEGRSGWADLDEEATPELRWPRNVEVYDRMRRQDAQVISVLRAVTLPIRRTAWRIDPNGARPEVARLVAEDLGLDIAGEAAQPATRTRDRFSWTEHLRQSLLMLAFGHSFFEQVYRIDGAGAARLRKLAWRPPKTIAQIDVAADGGLVAIEQHGAGAGKRPRMGVDRLVAYVNDREGGNWLGQSLLRPAYKYWLLKDRLLRVQAQTVDRNGMGVPVYEGSKIHDSVVGAERAKQEKEELGDGLALARGLRSGDSAGAAVPNGAKLSLKGVDGTLPDADKPIRYYDEQIARAVLAHFLNLGTETGSWALGSTFADFFTLSLQTVAMQVADTTTQHVIEDLVDLNWGPDEPAPRLVFDEIGSKHPATAEAVKMLVDCGAITPDEKLEQHLRTAHGLPPADPATARQPPAAPAPAGPTPASADPAGEGHRPPWHTNQQGGTHG
ncbi:DUF935 family protein [Sinomonas sp. ASV322]|uniref:phage portal protein family protein n=1 Tax=Sinomonas sp. ASV322 TaxID=3041920 RepID=UPI0027DBF850|nr:DUF935 family protein [Sinomonas sp. ASV322]MDQ4502174.1 DUF935 family protein [Sinomonas sp. ASV322]